MVDAHTIIYKREGRFTIAIINDLVKEGYNYIYLTACESRNHDYIFKFTNDTSTYTTYWSDYKDRGIHIYRSMFFGGIGK